MKITLKKKNYQDMDLQWDKEVLLQCFYDKFNPNRLKKLDTLISYPGDDMYDKFRELLINALKSENFYSINWVGKNKECEELDILQRFIEGLIKATEKAFEWKTKLCDGIGSFYERNLIKRIITNKNKKDISAFYKDLIRFDEYILLSRKNMCKNEWLSLYR